MSATVHTLKPGGGLAKPSHIQAERIGRLYDHGRRINCGHCSGKTSIASNVKLSGGFLRTVCPDCIGNYEEIVVHS